MNKKIFGALLRVYRKRARDQQEIKPLSQEKLAEGLEESGLPGYRDENISWWENGRRNLPERVVVVGLIQVLQQRGGILSLEEANRLLHAADYRSLDESEIERIAPPWKIREPVAEPIHAVEGVLASQSLGQADWLRWFLDWAFHWSEMDVHARSSWAGKVIWSFRAVTDRLAPDHFLVMLVCLALWGGTAWLVTPILQWPLDDPGQRLQACLKFAVASMAVPLCISLLTSPDGPPFQKKTRQEKARVFLMKLAGGYTGFNAFVLLLFVPVLIVYYLGWPALPGWLVWILMLIPLLFSHIGARRIPADRYKMYDGLPQLHGADKLVLGTFPFVGGAFAWFVYAWYELLANPLVGFLVLMGLAGIAFMERRKAVQRRTET